MFLALDVINFGMIELPLNIKICLWNFTSFVFSPNGYFFEGQTNEKYNLKNKGHCVCVFQPLRCWSCLYCQLSSALSSSCVEFSTWKGAATRYFIIVSTYRPTELLLYLFTVTCNGDFDLSDELTRNSSGDEIANVNFLCDDIVHALKYNRLLHKFRNRSFSATQVYQIQ